MNQYNDNTMTIAVYINIHVQWKHHIKTYWFHKEVVLSLEVQNVLLCNSTFETIIPVLHNYGGIFIVSFIQSVH